MVVDGGARRAKRSLRFRLRATRAHRSADEREQGAAALADRVLALPELVSPTTVACYSSTREEPGTAPLLARLATSGHTVLLPILLADFDLDWAAYHHPGALKAGRLGIAEPTGDPLGTAGVGRASVVICPGLAADERGGRLGRGGGSYDRVLARVPPEVLRVVLLYDDEVLPAVPTDDHDELVHVLVTPARTLRVGGSG